MVLQFAREQYKLGRFRYVISTDYSQRIISFDKMSQGNIVVSSDDPNCSFQMEIYPTFRNSQKNGIETKQQSGEFSLQTYSGGIINYCGKKGSNFLNGIYYWTFEIAGQKLIAYEVGFGRKGIYLCIWNEDQLLAVVSKDVHTKRFESKYIIYAENTVPVDLLSICSLYWDLTRYYPTSSAEEFHTLNTWQKELKNKYDPNFIKRICSIR